MGRSVALLGVLSLVSSCGRASDPPAVSAEFAARLRVAGFDDPGVVRDCVFRLQEAVARGDREELLRRIRYPFAHFDFGRGWTTYASPEELRPRLQEVFAAKVLQAIRDAKFPGLFANGQGAMIGDGEVWLGPSGAGAGIVAVNSRGSWTGRTWSIHGVKIPLRQPDVAVTRRRRDGSGELVHAWSGLQNDFHVPMIRVDRGSSLEEISAGDFELLKGLDARPRR
jgi:hypothetical protein